MKHLPKCLRHPLWLIAIILLVWYAVFGYKYGFIYNHGVSMQPTIQDGEWIIVEKKSFWREKWKPDRYDVVIIDDKKSKERLSKRVIGLPNDTIQVKEGVIYLNTRPLEDPFGKGKILVYLVAENEKSLRYWETGEWGNAGDPVVEMTNHREEKIPEGHVWVIGDNRSESWYGILPIKDIKGLAVIY